MFAVAGIPSNSLKANISTPASIAAFHSHAAMNY
jgi:hypothetical protein